MREVEITAARASDPSSFFRARLAEILGAWEAAEPAGAERAPVRAFIADCLEEVATSLDGGAERTPELGGLDADDLTCAARGLVVVREVALRRLERDGRPLVREQHTAGGVLDRALHAVLDRIALERDELGRMAADALASARLHQDAVELRERMLSVVSHDLRSPLAAIDLGGAVLLELPSTRGDPFVQKQIRVIRRNVERMSRLIRDLLDMSSIHAGRLTLEQQRCALSALLAETLEAHEELAREKAIALRSDLRLGERIARCDRDRLNQVLGHLLGNAIKFCDAGAEVTLLAEVSGAEARVAIADNGPGIPEPDLPHVFELFWKGRGGQRGTGLGLFVARGIVEAHGGRIGVESHEQQGSTFWFTLPLNETNESDAGP